MESTLENDALASTKKPSCCSKSLPKLICEGGMGGGMGGMGGREGRGGMGGREGRREGGMGGMGGREGGREGGMGGREGGREGETNLHEEPNDQTSNLPPLVPKTESTGQRDHTLTPSHPHSHAVAHLRWSCMTLQRYMLALITTGSLVSSSW